jgi:hypothetical protein
MSFVLFLLGRPDLVFLWSVCLLWALLGLFRRPPDAPFC